MCRPGQVGQVDSRMASVGVLDSWSVTTSVAQAVSILSLWPDSV